MDDSAFDQEGLGPASHSYFSQRLRLHYVDWGNPTAPPLLLIHGGRDHCRNWDWVARRLRNDFHVIAPDLRGHGDSAFSPSGDYSMNAFLYDIAQLIHQQGLAPLRIVAHSMGGSIALRYAGVYPENVSRLVAIEGLGRSPDMDARRSSVPPETRLANWISNERALAGRLPRRYASIEEAVGRMQSENRHLSPAQARHLTVHGVSQNEDGTYSWKFDNYVRSETPDQTPTADLHRLWGRITCPTLLVYGEESWASNPEKDGRLAHFKSANVVGFPGAGHWVHHDQLEPFVAMLRDFL